MPGLRPSALANHHEVTFAMGLRPRRPVARASGEVQFCAERHAGLCVRTNLPCQFREVLTAKHFGLSEPGIL